MTSRFFAGGDSDSESETESSENEVETQRPAAAMQATFMYDSSDSEEEKRVVKSEKDKHWEALENTINLIKNHLKINDWVAINNDFDLLMKQIGKAKNVIKKHGVPKFFIKAVLKIEDSLKLQDPKKNTLKKMSASNAKGVNTMRQKIRKHNKAYAQQIVAYNKAPLISEDEKEDSEEDSSEEDSDEEDSDEEEEKPKAKAKAKPAKKKDSSDDDDSDEDDDDDSDESDDESDDEDESGSEEWDTDSDDGEDQRGEDGEVDLAKMFGRGNPFSRDFWTKKVKVDDSKQKLEEIEQFVERVKLSYPGWEDDLASVKKDAKDGPMYVDKALRKMERKQKEHSGEPKEVVTTEKKEPAKVKSDEKVYTAEIIAKKLKELQQMRGKRGTDRRQVVRDLKHLATKATSSVVMLKVKTTLTAALFDSTMNTVKYMPRDVWLDLHKTLMDIIDVLYKDPMVRLSEDEEVKDAFEEEDEGMTLESLMEQEEEKRKRMEEKHRKLEEEREKQEAEGTATIQYVHGNLYAVVQRVVAEFRLSLQHIDPHSPDYVIRLRDERKVVDLVTKTQDYYQMIDKPALQRTVALLRLELVYYHYNPKLDVQGELRDQKVAPSRFGFFPAPTKDSDGNVSETHKLALFLYKSPDSREKMRALLCHVYHLALHNRCVDARNLLLMSHAQDTINDADIRTRILFNRTIAQMGLCYFRLGEVGQALNCLSELYQSNRFKELLAQGISSTRYGAERDLEKEKLERRRQYPYHMHINLDLLESVHLLSAMFLEVPNLAAFGTQSFTLRRNKRKVISKTFRRLLEHHSSKAFNGPPENTRDSVMACTRAMQAGDWKEAMVNIDRLKMWNLMSNSEVVKGMIRIKVKEVTLKTYLLTYGPQYASISLESLADMFELSHKDVYKLVSRMMFNDQLHGAWHQPSKCVIMQRHKPSQLQTVCADFADKAALFVEQNEKLLEQRYGFYTNKNQSDKKWGGGYNNNNNNNDNYQGRGSNNNNDFGNFRRDFDRRGSYKK